MAINKISGNILQDNLVRGSNLAIQGNLIYFDINNNRVGVLTSTPGDEFEVIGTANAANVRITSLTANRLLSSDSNNLVVSSTLEYDGANLTIPGTLIVTGNAVIDNVTIDGSTISSNTDLNIQSSGNITLTPGTANLVIIDVDTGLTIPSGNTAQRPGSPDAGTIRWNTSINLVEVYNGSTWEGVGQDLAIITDQTITGDGANVNFTLDQNTSANAIIVSTNGVVQRPGVAYTVAGNVITFAEAPQTTDIIDVRFIAELSWVNAISNDSGLNEIAVDPSGVANLSTTQSVQLPTYTVAQANALGNTASGQVIYVSNGDSGNPCLAVYSVNAWKIVSLGGNITP